MAKKITLNMITQRSVEEGVGIVSGKMSPEYFEACSIIEMHDDDVQALGLFPNQLVKVTSECGSVIVKAVKGRQTLYPALRSSHRSLCKSDSPATDSGNRGAPIQRFSCDGRTRTSGREAQEHA